MIKGAGRIRVKGILYTVDREGFVTGPDGLLVDNQTALLVRAAYGRRASRRMKNRVLRSMGLCKVRGALGGIYWE